MTLFRWRCSCFWCELLFRTFELSLCHHLRSFLRLPAGGCWHVSCEKHGGGVSWCLSQCALLELEMKLLVLKFCWGLLVSKTPENRDVARQKVTSLIFFCMLWKDSEAEFDALWRSFHLDEPFSSWALFSSQWISLRELLVGGGRRLTVTELWALCYTCLSSLQTYTDFPGDLTCAFPHNLRTLRTRVAADTCYSRGGRKWTVAFWASVILRICDISFYPISVFMSGHRARELQRRGAFSKT